MPDSNIVKVYVRPDDTALIVCPHCSRKKLMPVGSYKGIKSRFKIKCGCNNVFVAMLDFRKKFRKKTNLHGKFTNHSRKNIKGDIVIKNLSMDGLGFTTEDINKLQKGDEITVAFELDNTRRTTIQKEVIVRDIQKKTVGCEFKKSYFLSRHCLKESNCNSAPSCT